MGAAKWAIYALAAHYALATALPPLGPGRPNMGSDRDLPGTFVSWRELDQCPHLKRRPIPSRADDV